MNYCHACGLLLADGMQNCPNCRNPYVPSSGGPLGSASYRRSTPIWPIVTIVAVVVVVGLMAGGAALRNAARKAEAVREQQAVLAQQQAEQQAQEDTKRAIQSVEDREEYLSKGYEEALNQLNLNENSIKTREDLVAVMDKIDNASKMRQDFISEDRNIDLSGCPRDYADAHEKMLTALSNMAYSFRSHPRVPGEDESEAEWDRIMTVNVKSVFLSARAALPAMIAQGWGRIITCSSIVGLRYVGKGVSMSYGASKAAVAQLTRQMALEFADKGITCNCVAIVMIDSPMSRAAFGDQPVSLHDCRVSR